MAVDRLLVLTNLLLSTASPKMACEWGSGGMGNYCERAGKLRKAAQYRLKLVILFVLFFLKKEYMALAGSTLEVSQMELKRTLIKIEIRNVMVKHKTQVLMTLLTNLL